MTSRADDIHYGLSETTEILLTSEAGDKIAAKDNVSFVEGIPTGPRVVVRPNVLKQTMAGIAGGRTVIVNTTGYDTLDRFSDAVLAGLELQTRGAREAEAESRMREAGMDAEEAAWLARRWEDPAFPRAFPWFGENRYWEDHVLALREQASALQEPPLQP